MPRDLLSEPNDLLGEEPQKRSGLDKLLGIGGERYQLWPERMLREAAQNVISAAAYPGDVMTGKATVPFSPQFPGGGDNRDAGRLGDLLTLAAPVSAASRGRMVAAKPKVPTQEELKTAYKAAYKEFRDSGLVVDPRYIKVLAAELEQKLVNEGFDEDLAKQTFKTLRRMANPPRGSVVTASNIDTLRKSLRKAAKPNINSPEESPAAIQVIRALDRFMEAPPKGSVLAGPPAAASRAHKKARGNFAAYKRSETVTGTTKKAISKAARSNSGQNVDNTIRQRLGSLLDKEKDIRGFTPEEVSALTRVTEGVPGANAARNTGNFLGGGGGLGAMLTSGLGGASGFSVGGVPGAVVGSLVLPAAGRASKGVGAALTKRGVRQVDEQLRKRSPLYEERLANPGLREINPEARAAIVRALMLQQ